MHLFEEIQKLVTDSIGECDVQVFDPRCDMTHLEAIVVSDSFEGKSLVARQRLVMQALKPLFQTSLHALALKTWTVKEWEVKRNG